ncbi:tyrosine--tRNA ligase [Spirochaeta isovalerica]|uniref:Tyrosine--tRNA ligase n=1 Tax=Spirochaeta isovalerica TaxID=150 RepID=A0A841R6U4_9SPIO|nr:tyrosine--tRNA ligase [Spirochaeta isovalerica]MBB6479553.1 tyrosyl-tRNA synthetase [Spirochaeta isovalerica]
MNLKTEVERQMKILSSGTVEIIPENELREKISHSLLKGEPLRVKVGIDPTSPHVHIGHMVIYGKLRQFQDLGHKAVLVIGDYTARIGDPTGRNRERAPLSEEDVLRNSRTYRDQIFKIVDESKTEVHFQSEGFDSLTLQDILNTASAFSTAHMLTHETFRKRLEKGDRLSLHELFYPVLQAWDSLLIKSDVELGGMDQKFNILCGRDLQKNRGMTPQAALFMPLLEGTDGRKMSKSFGNHIPVDADPQDMFGKVMSIKDDLILPWFSLAAQRSSQELSLLKVRLEKENPRDVKMELASEIVSLYHGTEKAERCRLGFISQFSRRELPEEIPLFFIDPKGMKITGILKESGLLPSISEARRLIIQGGLKIDGDPVRDPDFILRPVIDTFIIIKAGKRKYLKVKGR